ncbi:MAG: alpha/beta fold hydrolase [Rouxiella aceris]|uniref:alpha/beta fold hydrolase n=1 Tax=Rouxiella aceris TaxID=2703884 RepID=UPI002841EFDA|nr:alpha/beta fold hydrolase [Rouxiella aceris]MDR3434520.1 alpha/beta fold hydrolase [Rouxiella aceris]
MTTEHLPVVKIAISADGTRIGYQSFGNGPGIVLVQGAMGTAQNYRQLAVALASRFTVHVPDRRGRGMSPRPYSAAHLIQRDVEDLRCLLADTGAQFLFGLSSGAMIVLEGLRCGLPVKRAAVFEPPFYLDGMAHELVHQFNAQVDQGRLAAALVTAGRIVGLGPKLMRVLPQWLLRLGAGLALRGNARRTDNYTSIKELIPAMRYDFNVVASMNTRLHDLSIVQQRVLLMGGDRSPDYLKNALLALKVVLPSAEVVEFTGADHSAPWNEDLSGKPQLVSSVLNAFFSTPQTAATTTG